MSHLVTECAIGLASSVVLMSFIEHQAHQTMMHKKHPLSKYIKALEKVFKHHAILHHSTYKEVFADAPVAKGEDRGIQLNLREGFVEALPFSAIMAIVSIPTAIIFEGVVACHHLVWNAIHLNMHKPVPVFFEQWPAYKFLVRHHYLHHVHPDKNFNVVLPLADYVMGTAWKATPEEIAEMHRQGMYCEPRVLEGASK
jgi:hypothetical protein